MWWIELTLSSMTSLFTARQTLQIVRRTNKVDIVSRCTSKHSPLQLEPGREKICILETYHLCLLIRSSLLGLGTLRLYLTGSSSSIYSQGQNWEWISEHFNLIHTPQTQLPSKSFTTPSLSTLKRTPLLTSWSLHKSGPSSKIVVHSHVQLQKTLTSPSKETHLLAWDQVTAQRTSIWSQTQKVSLSMCLIVNRNMRWICGLARTIGLESSNSRVKTMTNLIDPCNQSTVDSKAQTWTTK